MLLHLPVKPYIGKFLARHWGADYQLGRTDAFGRYLYGLLRQPRGDRQYEKFLRRYTQQIPVKIVPYLVADRACKNMTAETIVQFSTFVEDIFFLEFHQYVQLRVEFGGQAKQAILDFCQRHELTEEEAPFETMKRSWQRYWQKEQDKQKKPPFSGNSPSSLSLAA